MIALMLGVDHHKVALVAVTEEKVVGHAMYARLVDGTEAEIAIIVEDEWQSKGVGKSLLSELAQRARLRGVETFSAEVLATNRPMLGLAAMFAGTDYAMADGVCHVRMPLQTPGSTPYTARTDRRAAHKDWITTHDKHARQTREEKSYIKDSAFPGYGTLRNEPGSNPTREHRK